MKIRSMEVELFHADGQMDRRNGANSRFSEFCKTKNYEEKFVGDIKIFRRFYALRISSLIASLLFLKPINFILQTKLATLHSK
jgi:hypothetical protein